MGIEEVANIIGKIADGLEEACIECLSREESFILLAISEQLYSGLDGEEKYLEPNYDNDPYFEEEGEWYHRGDAYKAWKMSVTKPVTSPVLRLSPRPAHIPNLYIDGTFYGEINVRRQGDAFITDPGIGRGLEIEEKWGNNILDLGPTAIEYFNVMYLLPSIGDFFQKCGYR